MFFRNVLAARTDFGVVLKASKIERGLTFTELTNRGGFKDTSLELRAANIIMLELYPDHEMFIVSTAELNNVHCFLFCLDETKDGE